MGKAHEEEVLICCKAGIGGTMIGLAWEWSRVCTGKEKKKMFGLKNRVIIENCCLSNKQTKQKPRYVNCVGEAGNFLQGKLFQTTGTRLKLAPMVPIPSW